MILTDALADRLAAVHLEGLTRYAEAYAKVRSDTARWELRPGFALYAGEGSPLTQAFGFGHRTAADPAVLDEFFEACGAQSWEVGVTPFTDSATVAALFQKGYRFQGFEGELAMTVESLPDEPEVEIVEVGEDTAAWLEATSRGWDGNEDEAYEPSEIARVAALVDARRYVAFVDGVPAAASAMTEHGDAVALMGGATRVPYRGRGLQTAMFARRLRDAGRGRLATVGAVPGSSSFRNAQRAGFASLYSTVTLMRR